MEPPPNALCLSCGYSLQCLTTNRCPECGRVFDPADPKSMNLGRRPGIIARFILRPTGWWPVIVLLLAAILILTASRWPRGAVLLGPLDLPYYFSSIHIQSKLLSYTDWAYAGSLIAAAVVILALIGLQPLKAILRRIYRQPPPPPSPVNLGRRMMLGMIAILAMGGSVMVSWPYRIARIWIRQIMGMPPYGTYSWHLAPPRSLTADQTLSVLRTAVMQLPTSIERTAALKLLIEKHSDCGLPILLEAIKLEPDPQVRATQIRLIGLFRQIPSVDAMLAFWNDPDANVRGAVTDAIGWIHAPAYVAQKPNLFRMYSPWVNTNPQIHLAWGSSLSNQFGQQATTVEVGRQLDYLRPRFEQRMVSGDSRVEREAAARAILNWQDDYKLRVAEWGVWIAAKGKFTLIQSLIEEIPPFVHQTGDRLVTLKDHVNEVMFVDKPVLHFTVDRPMCVDVQVMINQGRPWFAFPPPDDFAVATEMAPRRVPSPTTKNTYIPNVPELEQLDPEKMPGLKDARTGYPWLDPAHRTVGSISGEMDSANQIVSLGLRWQSVIVSPDRLGWMQPPAIPSDPKFQWWDRLRKVPCSWVSNRGESERFLYYDGPTMRAPRLGVALEGMTLTILANLGSTPKGVSQSEMPFDPTPHTNDNFQTPCGMFIRISSTRSPPTGCIIEPPGKTDLAKMAMLQGDALIQRFHRMLTDAGLTDAEAAGLVDCWRPQFFQTPGSRFVLLLTPEDYDSLCPIRIDPKPTELVRVGLVLTEFGTG